LSSDWGLANRYSSVDSATIEFIVYTGFEQLRMRHDRGLVDLDAKKF